MGNLVVRDAMVIANHHSLNGGWNNRNFNVPTGKRFDRSQGLPHCDNFKLCTAAQLAPQYGCANETRESSELRERLTLEVFDVAIGVFTLAESLPMSRYHRALARTVDGDLSGA
jgi:hypothetical protein